MAKTSLLDPAGPITGAETVPILQDGALKQANMAAYAAAVAAPAVAAVDAAKTATEVARDQAIVAAEAIQPQAASYVNEFGSGDRVTSLTTFGARIWSDIVPSSGALTNLFNGNVTANLTHAVNWGVGVELANKDLVGVQWKKGLQRRITRVRIKNSGAQSYGEGHVMGLRFDGVWENITAAPVAFGGAAERVIDISANIIAYYGYKLHCTDGLTAAGWMLEVEFEIARGVLDGLYQMPFTTDRGKVPTQKNSVAGDTVMAEPFDYFRTIPAGHTPLFEYLYDGKDSDNVVKDYGPFERHISLADVTAAYGGNFAWTKKGLLLSGAILPTVSITGYRTLVLVLQPEREDAGKIQLSTGATTGPMYIRGSDFNGTNTWHTGHGGEAVKIMLGDRSGSGGVNGTNATALSRGDAILVFIENPGALTSQICLGGSIAVATTNRATKMTAIYMAGYASVFTDAERTFYRTGLSRVLSRTRGIILDPRDAETYVLGSYGISQSNGGNASIPLSGLSADRLARGGYTPSTWILSAGRINEPYMIRPQQYRLGFNSVPNWAPALGYELGMAVAHEEALQTISRDLAICKVAPGSASVAGSGGNLDWNVATTLGTGLRGFGYARLWDMQAHFHNRGIGFRLVRINFQNGEQEAGSIGLGAGYPALYKPAMQALIADLRTNCRFTGLTFKIGQLPPWEVGSPLIEASVNSVRDDQTTLVLDNADCSLVPTGAGMLQVDKLHLTANDSYDRGRTGFYPGFPRAA